MNNQYRLFDREGNVLLKNGDSEQGVYKDLIYTGDWHAGLIYGTIIKIDDGIVTINWDEAGDWHAMTCEHTFREMQRIYKSN